MVYNTQIDWVFMVIALNSKYHVTTFRTRHQFLSSGEGYSPQRLVLKYLQLRFFL
jgi:hypothetical protein